MYHRPYPTVRNTSSSNSVSNSASQSHPSSPRLTPLLPPSPLSSSHPPVSKSSLAHPNGNGTQENNAPTLCGMPLKYVSLVTLAVQNAALSIVMHYSRVSTPPSRAYSPASAVLLNELLKGTISFMIALSRVPPLPQHANHPPSHPPAASSSSISLSPSSPSGISSSSISSGNPSWHQNEYPPSPLFHTLRSIIHPFTHVCNEIFSPDCWKLSIPAILYVVQNSLQFVAISNLPVASFQVTYQMKILTTAAFSVALLRKRLTTTKWLSLFFLAIGVGIVQIQTAGTSSNAGAPTSAANEIRRELHVGSAHDSAPLHIHVMSPLKGFGAVTAACFTSGLAGVYFEMVLKNSKADLWVRNIQLSLFSLIPALLPILYSSYSAPYAEGSFFQDLFRHFGPWAWATVAVQVLGGLITAVVIKYSDNILKGFATSLSIVLSFLASVVLFDFRMTPSFVIGATTVLAATWMYNQPAGKEGLGSLGIGIVKVGATGGAKGRGSKGMPFSPLDDRDPILGEVPGMMRKKSSPFGSPRAIASALGLGATAAAPEKDLYGNAFGLAPYSHAAGNGHGNDVGDGFCATLDTARYMNAPYGSPYNSRPPSRSPSQVPSRVPSPLPPSPLGSDSGNPGAGVRRSS